MFGRSYYSAKSGVDKLSSITKPFYYANESSDDVGFRLVRYKKESASLVSKRYNLMWKREDANSKNYVWDKLHQTIINKSEYLGWVYKHEEQYPSFGLFGSFLRYGMSDPVGYLKKFKEMILDGYNNHRVRDIASLAGLINIEKLILRDNRISDIAPLASLTKLENLDLNRNFEFSDLTPLAGLKNLKKLYLSWNRFSDISPLMGLVNLEILDLSENGGVSDFTPLKGLIKLKYLDLSENWQISDLTFLGGLTNLEELNLLGNEISDITPLANLMNLKKLYIDCSKSICDETVIDKLRDNGCLVSDYRL